MAEDRDDRSRFLGGEELTRAYPYGAVVTFDREMRYTSAGGRGFDPLEVGPDDLVGRTIFQVWPEETARLLEPHYRRALDGEEVEIRVPYAERVYRNWIGPLYGGDGEVEGGVGFTWDITDYARREQELGLVRRAVAELDVGLTIAEVGDGDHPIIFVNDSFCAMTGYERREVLGRDCRFLQGDDTDPEKVASIRAALDAREPVQVTLENYRKSGEKFWNRLSIYPIRGRGSDEMTHFVGIQEDVTDARRLGREFERNERLSALGQLAGGVAHDIRNVLMSVTGLVELVLEDTELSPGVVEDLQAVRQVVERGSSVTARLLAFAREEILNHGHIELGHALRERVAFFEHVLRENVAIEVERCDEPAWTLGDHGQLDQVFLNLVKNGEEAMPEGGTLRFWLVTGPEAEEPFPDHQLDKDVAGWVRVTVADSGSGMEPEVLDRAFDPFFTTKESGTGLGLASAYGTIGKMGGAIYMESEPGQGTTVHLAFPETSPPDEKVEVATEPGDQEAVTATVLLVEDEDAVRNVCRRALENAGHTVREATDVVEALAVLEREVAEIDLLLTDAVIPQGSGLQVAEAFRSLAPDQPIILMSGYTADEIDRDRVGDKVDFLSKPFNVEELVQRVATALVDG